MKKIKASELRVGDIFYYHSMYSIVIPSRIHDHVIRSKCFMAPSNSSILIGTGHYIHPNTEVLLCERDSNEEN